MNDYQKAKEVVETLKLHKRLVLAIEDISFFRRYLSIVSGKTKRKFVTKKDENGVKVIRIE